MHKRIRVLRQLVADSQYVIDAAAVADAIIARAAARRLVAEVRFRNDIGEPEVVRSFRPTKKARSFRPCNLPSTRTGRRAMVAEYGL
jgi:hypothetical protein